MTISINQIEAVTHRLVLNKLTDGVYRSNAMLARAYKARVKLDGGTKVASPVIHGAVDETTGGWYSGAENLVDAEKDDITNAEVNWKQIYETVMIARSDILKNNGKSQVLNLVASKVQIAEKRMKSRLVTGYFSDGTNAKVFNGLAQIVSATGDYAGLAIGDIEDEFGNDSWLAQVKANSGTARALSLALIQQTMGAATEDSDKPTVAVSVQKVYDELWNLLSPHQRLMTSDSMSGLGHKGVLEYNGIPFIVDAHSKAGSMYFLNEEYLKLYVHQDEDMRVQSFPQLEGQNAIKRRVLLMGNILCTNRRFQAELADIKVAS